MDINNSLSFSDIVAAIEAVILFLGLGATVLTLYYQNRANKRLATLQLILHQRADDRLKKAVDIVSTLTEEYSAYDDLSHYLDPKREGNQEKRNAILTVLNYREFVSVGINKGIIDEESYKQAFWSLMCRDWKIFQKTVLSIREDKKSPTLFQDFELLAKKWEKEPLKKYKK